MSRDPILCNVCWGGGADHEGLTCPGCGGNGLRCPTCHGATLLLDVRTPLGKRQLVRCPDCLTSGALAAAVLTYIEKEIAQCP